MSVHIAIPEPTSSDAAYNARSLPQYIAALQSVGAIATVVPLHERQDRVAKLLSTVSGILLPGSGFDVDPQRYGQERIEACGLADPPRTLVDEQLLTDAFEKKKPVLAICYGVQSLNVWRGGTLIQDLAADGKTGVNHAPGRTINEAHEADLASGSRLAHLAAEELPDDGSLRLLVNSSHHQALHTPGRDLQVTATSPQDGVIEAVELDARDHFVLGIQWHPERTFTTSALSRALFGAFVHAAQAWKPGTREPVPTA